MNIHLKRQLGGREVKEFHNALESKIPRVSKIDRYNDREIPMHLVASFIPIGKRVGKYFIPNPFPIVSTFL